MTSISTSQSSDNDSSRSIFAAFGNIFGKQHNDQATSQQAVKATSARRRRWSQHHCAEPPITADEAMNLSRAISRGRQDTLGNEASSTAGFLTRVLSADANFASPSAGSNILEGGADSYSTSGSGDASSSPRPPRAMSAALSERRNSSRRRRNSGSKYQGIGLVAAYSGPSAF